MFVFLVFIMVYCKVVDCKSEHGKVKVSWHAFPKDSTLRKQWISRLNRQNYKWRENHKVCGLHFRDPEDFISPSPQQAKRLNFERGRYDLVTGAVPSLNLGKKRGTLGSDTAFVIPTKKPRMAVVKRQNLKILKEMQSRPPSPDVMDALQLSEDDAAVEISDVLSVETDQLQRCEQEPRCEVATQTDLPEKHDAAVECHIVLDRVTTHAKGSQTKKLKTENKITSTDLPSINPTRTVTDTGTSCNLMRHSEEISEPSSHEDLIFDCSDSDYLPSEVDSSENDLSDTEETHTRERLLSSSGDTFLVSAASLLQILHICLLCGKPRDVWIRARRGTAILVEAFCNVCCNPFTWWSQALLGYMPEMNLRLAAACLFSGCSPVKALNLLQHAKIQGISMRTYNLMQKCYLVPSVNAVWRRQQQILLQDITEAVKLGGDGRCDSPGHSAKYGTYTMMDLDQKKVLDLQLVQCNETTSSNAMEVEGFKRGLAHLESKGVKVDHIVTDRHASIRKFLRTERPDVTHYFDIWHVAKGVRKKLVLAAGKKENEVIKPWIPSIVNQLYWAATTSNGDGNQAMAKWRSIKNHIADIHVHHDPDYPMCQHVLLEDRVWIEKGSKPHKAVEDIVDCKRLCGDIRQLSPEQQTYAVEVFHKVVCFFAPKSSHFFFPQMQARGFIAALHFNSNSARKQLTSRRGEKIWSVSYPKFKKGTGVLKEVKEPITYDYVDNLMEEVFRMRNDYPTYAEAVSHALRTEDEVPASLSSTFTSRTDKASLVQRQHTRFTC